MLWHALTARPLSCGSLVLNCDTASTLIPSTRHMPQQLAEGSEVYAVAHTWQPMAHSEHLWLQENPVIVYATTYCPFCAGVRH